MMGPRYYTFNPDTKEVTLFEGTHLEYFLEIHRSMMEDPENRTVGGGYSIAHTQIDIADTEMHISTVFLGTDISFRSHPHPPLIFETKVFNGEEDDYTARYSTYDEAMAGHEEAVALVKGSLETPEHKSL